jgi:predicted nucleic acid-binding Zn ribbon protein
MAHDPQPLSVALAELIALRGFARVRGDEELHSAWKQIAGDEVAGQTRPLQIKRSVLTVAVSSAPLLNELVSFQSAELLGRLKQQFPHLNVKSLKFRLNGM